LIVAIELAPSYIDAYNSKVDALVRLKKYENALEVLDNAFKINRYHSTSLFNKGKIFYFLKKFSEGDEFLDMSAMADSNLLRAVNQLKNLKSLDKDKK